MTNNDGANCRSEASQLVQRSQDQKPSSVWGRPKRLLWTTVKEASLTDHRPSSWGCIFLRIPPGPATPHLWPRRPKHASLCLLKNARVPPRVCSFYRASPVVTGCITVWHEGLLMEEDGGPLPSMLDTFSSDLSSGSLWTLTFCITTLFQTFCT